MDKRKQPSATKPAFELEFRYCIVIEELVTIDGIVDIYQPSYV